jgi:protein gp37
MRHKRYLEHNGIEPKNGRALPKQYARPFNEIQLLPDRLEEPLHIRQPQKFFVNSMSDLFHSQVTDDYIKRVFATMNKAYWHTFQILTKRPGRLRQIWPHLNWSPNIAIGVSIELDPLCVRADVLRDIPAGWRFLSCEPLLGPLPSLNLDRIDWVIAGGESGPEARTCQQDWIRGIRDTCLEQRSAFFFKQWGGRTPKAGGDTLDGRSWHQFPAGMVNIPVDAEEVLYA